VNIFNVLFFHSLYRPPTLWITYVFSVASRPLELVGALVAGVHPVLRRDGLQAVEEGVVVQAAEVLRAGLLKQFMQKLRIDELQQTA
jgi:hypothetical protein